ncbi:MAG: DUF2785 domain-containing protein [Verrucomicrobiota bacterium]
MIDSFRKAKAWTILPIFLVIGGSPLSAAPGRPATFWKSIVEHQFEVPANESAGALALEVADLAASTDPALRDGCGYDILARWIYQDHRLGPAELEVLRKKLIPAMTGHIGEFGNDSIFSRSFSGLYMSLLAAEDLQKPFMSPDAFKETLATGLRCYAGEKDLRGYVPVKGWAHATAHVADLLKFLSRNEKLSVEQQNQIVAAIMQRCRTTGLVFTWGEDARMAAALLSLVNRKDFDASSFEKWFQSLPDENKALWSAPAIDPKVYASVRAQGNVLTHLAAKIAAQKESNVPAAFRDALTATLAQVN